MEGYKRDLPFAMDHFAPGFMENPQEDIWSTFRVSTRKMPMEPTIPMWRC